MRRIFRARAAAVVAGAILVVSGATGLGIGAASGQAAPTATTSGANQPVPAGATLLPNGRLVSPAGAAHDLGDFPLGLAISPDGRLSVASGVGQGDGRPNSDFGDLCRDAQHNNPCAPSTALPKATTGPDEALFVTDLSTGARTTVRAPQSSCAPTTTNGVPAQTFQCFELGVAFSPDGRHLYAVGGGNDAVYDFPVSTSDTIAPAPRVLYLQQVNGAPGGGGSYQKPNPGTQAGRTKGLAVTPDGQHLLVTKEQAGTLDIIRASDLSFEQEVPFAAANPTGSSGSGTYPYEVAIAPDGSRAYVSLQGVGSLGVLPLSNVAGRLTAGAPTLVPAGDHPTGLAVSPDGKRLLVADANGDTAAAYDTSGPIVGAPQLLPLHAIPGEQVGSVPDSVAFDGADHAYVALAGDDAVAALSMGSTGWHVDGLLPTGWYPTAVAVRPGSRQVVAVAAKGLGSRYPSGGELPPPAVGGPQAVLPGYYDGNNMAGLLTVADAPDAMALSAGTSTVRRNITFAQQGVAGLAHGPVPTSEGGGSPIKHVVYIVRENRTYDQVFGDLRRTRPGVDADPAFESLASATPTAHAVAGRYATSDRFFSDGEASVQGHYWTATANVDDYVEKSWRQYYSDRNHSQDSVGTTVSEPKGCSLFQAAMARQAKDPSFSWMDFGEPVGVDNPSITPPPSVPGVPGAGPNGLARTACGAVPASNVDLTNFGNFLGLDDRNSAQRFLAASGLKLDGTSAGAGGLRNFNYLELPGDHTTGFTPQGPTNINGNTPRAQIAQNDAAVGMVLGALSRSSYWKDTAVFVVEDDSQDGPDHVDGHRNVLLAASPYIRQQSADGHGGYIGHLHHDQADVVRTMELLLGFPPLSSYDQQAAPLYDLFQNKSTPAELTGADLAPFTAPAPPAFIDEKVASASPTPATQTLLADSRGLDLSGVDRAGPMLESVLWRSTTDRPLPAQLRAEVAGAPQPGVDPDDARPVHAREIVLAALNRPGDAPSWLLPSTSALAILAGLGLLVGAAAPKLRPRRRTQA